FQKILETSASQASAVEKRMEAYTSRLELRLAQLPKELETGLDPPRIAKLLGESLRQSFQRTGLLATCSALSQSCTELNSVQKQLLSVLREWRTLTSAWLLEPEVPTSHSCRAWRFVLRGWKTSS